MTALLDLPEQLLRDHHSLDLIRAFVDLGGLNRSSVWCRVVLHNAAELRRLSMPCWAVLACVVEY